MSVTEDGISGELREDYAEVGDQRLHYVEAVLTAAAVWVGEADG